MLVKVCFKFPDKDEDWMNDDDLWSNAEDAILSAIESGLSFIPEGENVEVMFDYE